MDIPLTSRKTRPHWMGHHSFQYRLFFSILLNELRPIGMSFLISASWSFCLPPSHFHSVAALEYVPLLQFKGNSELLVFLSFIPSRITLAFSPALSVLDLFYTGCLNKTNKIQTKKQTNKIQQKPYSQTHTHTNICGENYIFIVLFFFSSALYNQLKTTVF